MKAQNETRCWKRSNDDPCFWRAGTLGNFTKGHSVSGLCIAESGGKCEDWKCLEGWEVKGRKEKFVRISLWSSMSKIKMGLELIRKYFQEIYSSGMVIFSSPFLLLAIISVVLLRGNLDKVYIFQKPTCKH